MESIKHNHTEAYPPDFSEAYDKCLWRFAINAAPQIYDLYLQEEFKGEYQNWLLDLCCGPGHLSHFFLERGFFTTGIDLSKTMLRLAGERCKEYVNQSEWTLANASQFDLGKRFGLVASTFSSLNLLLSLEQLAGCFQSVYKHLEEGGTFIFDMTTRLGAEYHNNVFFRDMGDYTIITNGYFNKEECKASLHFLGFFKTDDSSCYKKFEHHQVETLYKITDVEIALKETGFNDIQYYVYGVTGVQSVPEPESVLNVVIKTTKNG